VTIDDPDALAAEAENYKWRCNISASPSVRSSKRPISGIRKCATWRIVSQFYQDNALISAKMFNWSTNTFT